MRTPEPNLRADAVAAAFERRALRAQALATESSSARAPLEFAAGLYRAQAVVAGAIARAHAKQPLLGCLDRDLDRFAADLTSVVGFVADQGPPILAATAAALGGAAPRERLHAFWVGNASGRDDYLTRALLRPYAELLAAAGLRPDRDPASGGCPFCGGHPWIAARRAPPSGAARLPVPPVSPVAPAHTGAAPYRAREPDVDGAQRVLGCGLCGGEWPVNRVHCPACGEETPDKLPSFHSDRYPAVRIEACGTCAIYVKSIDLTLDARAIPEIDDLASLAVDLWAVDQGYTRLEPGLAGV